jgi:beta-glucanase (GH16 family)
MFGTIRAGMLAVAAALAVIVVAVAGSGTAAARSSTRSSNFIFDDEFNGSAVRTPWVINTQCGNASANYWTDQCFVNDRQHVSVSGGYLSLTATYAPNGDVGGTYFESGAINVPASAWSYLYGTAQARVKVPCQSGKGLWPGFWQYASQTPFDDSNGEIDSLELMDNTQASNGTVVPPGTLVSQSLHGTNLFATSTVYNSNWCGAFHVFGNTWTPTSVSFTVDGVTEQTFNKTDFTAWPLTTPQAPVLSLLVGAYGGTPDPATFPQTMLVDWVRISQP